MARTITTKSVTKVKGGPGNELPQKLKPVTVKEAMSTPRGSVKYSPERLQSKDKNRFYKGTKGMGQAEWQFMQTQQEPTNPVKKREIKTVKQIKTEARSEKREDRQLKRVARATKK